ncbi:sialoadhesin-like [Mugil cephalus]|uniref:sialoadhesin-like n=1 Tax=Mugil cephalus TaxID=48193 RepID=UPI001FB7CCD6|nr:sialoadhesin-like [Mugil cephalus]
MGQTVLCVLVLSLTSTLFYGNAQVSSKATVILQHNWPQIFTGETITLRCEIQGGGRTQWTYEWKQDELNKPSTSREYRINGATESDSGEYRCRGRRGYNLTEWSDTIRLTVSVPSGPTVTLHPNWPEVYSGEMITLRCEIHGVDAEWEYEWSSTSSFKPSNQRELRISSASPLNSGDYMCKGRNKSAENSTEWSASVKLTVSDSKLQLNSFSVK